MAPTNIRAGRADPSGVRFAMEWYRYGCVRASLSLDDGPTIDGAHVHAAGSGACDAVTAGVAGEWGRLIYHALSRP